MNSIRRRLTSGLLISLLLVLAVFGVLLFILMRGALFKQFDEGLLAKARSLAPLAMLEPLGTIEFEFSSKMMPSFSYGPNPDYFELWHEDGRRFAKSESLGSGLDLPMPTHATHESKFINLELSPGLRVRTVYFMFFPPPDPDDDFSKSRYIAGGALPPRMVLMVAQSRKDLDQTLRRLLLLIASAWIGLPLLIAIVVHLGVKRGMRPLDRLALEADHFDFSHLQHRFEEAEMPLELRPICQRLNDLLQRVEDAFKSIEAAYNRERRFSDDVAHELRTPIAELHSLSEIALMFPHKEELGRKALNETLAISRQLERLVATLLSLARCEAGIAQLHQEWIDLDEILTLALSGVGERANHRATTIVKTVAVGTQVYTDRAMLNSILGNLLSNAVEYCPEGESVHIVDADEAGAVILRITNANATLARQDLNHIFEPFWRKDASRTNTGHCGLGLALVQSMCRLLKIDFSVELNEAKNAVIATIKFIHSGVS